MDAPRPDPPIVTHTMDPEQWRLARRCLWVLGVLSAGSALGTAFSLWLVGHYPLVLIALSPLGRHLVLAAPVSDPAALLAVVLVRRMVFYLALFYLGRALGPAGIDWLEARSARFGRFVRWMERLFARAAHAVVLVMAGPTVSALAGMSGMHVGVFLALATPGLAVRMLLVIGFAEWFRQPIEWLLALIDEYWIPGTVVMASGVALHQWLRLRSARAQRTGSSQG